MARDCEDCCYRLINPKSNRKLCTTCARIRNLVYTTAWVRRRRKRFDCTNCGADISHRRAHAKFCEACFRRNCLDRVNAQRAARRDKGTTRSRGSIQRDHVFRRDGYICHICGLPTSEQFTVEDPNSPVLDHVIPLCDERTPGHVLANLACAHRICNSRKSGTATENDWRTLARLKREILERTS